VGQAKSRKQAVSAVLAKLDKRHEASPEEYSWFGQHSSRMLMLRKGSPEEAYDDMRKEQNGQLPLMVVVRRLEGNLVERTSVNVWVNERDPALNSDDGLMHLRLSGRKVTVSLAR
jgi:hypothetical protein